MSVLKTLTREHRLFSRLLERLKRTLSLGEDDAKREVQNGLLVLFPALDLHERIEDVAFEPSALEPAKGRRAFLDKVERQHGRIHALRKDALELLGSSQDSGPARLRTLVKRLVETLTEHFKTEEELLWPDYARLLKAGRSLERRVAKKVAELEIDVKDRERAIEDYLGSRR